MTGSLKVSRLQFLLSLTALCVSAVLLTVSHVSQLSSYTILTRPYSVGLWESEERVEATVDKRVEPVVDRSIYELTENVDQIYGYFASKRRSNDSTTSDVDKINSIRRWENNWSCCDVSAGNSASLFPTFYFVHSTSLLPKLVKSTSVLPTFSQFNTHGSIFLSIQWLYLQLYIEGGRYCITIWSDSLVVQISSLVQVLMSAMSLNLNIILNEVNYSSHISHVFIRILCRCVMIIYFLLSAG